MHIMEEHNPHFALSDFDQQYYEELKMVFCFLNENYHSHSMAIDLMQQIKPKYTTARVKQMISDCENIFGRISKINKEYERYATRERLLARLKYFDQTKDTASALAIEKLLMKLGGLDKSDHEDFDYSSLSMPSPVFTSDPKALGEGARIVYDDYEEEE